MIEFIVGMVFGVIVGIVIGGLAMYKGNGDKK